MEIKREPSLDWARLVGGLMIYIGVLMFLIILHLLAINESGNTASVLVTTFKVFIYIYIAMVFFGLAGAVIHLLKWLTWTVTTPEWKKEKIKKGIL